MIKWLIERQNEGLRINHAVELWRSFEEAGQEPLLAMTSPEQPKQTATPVVLSGVTLNEIREKWVGACLAFDEASAENLLAQAFARYPMETVCLEVLRQGLSQVGELWHSGGSTVQQEHFASALAIRRLNALLAAAPPPSRRGKIMTACPPGEEHIFPLLLITLFLRQRGWNVVYLGANVPLSKLNEAIQTSKPDLIISTAQQLSTAANLYEVAQFLKAGKVPLAYGGLVFNLLPNIRERIPGYFLGESLDGIVQTVEHILISSPEIPKVVQVTNEYHQAAEHFKEYQPLIAAQVWKQLQHNGMKEHHLEIANDFLGQDIQASLILGDMNLMEKEMDWLSGLLQTHDIPRELLPEYLALYKQAVESNLDGRGQPIVDWFNSIIIES
jgi:methanogenic corrinoid protein MtbC1